MRYVAAFVVVSAATVIASVIPHAFISSLTIFIGACWALVLILGD